MFVNNVHTVPQAFESPWNRSMTRRTTSASILQTPGNISECKGFVYEARP